MPGPYRLYGADLSPYSIKVRNYLRFKGIEHVWLPRTAARQAEFARFARLPLVPVLVGSDDFALQDSTPIIEKLEAQNPEPTIRPDDEALQFLAALIEDYADEWVNKAMFHYRWSHEADQTSAAERIVAMIYDGEAAPEGAVEAIRTRMIGRLHHVGSSPAAAPVIEASFARLIGLVEAHLNGRPYLFGQRPCLADFGLSAQLGQLLSDPTPGAILCARAPHTVAWIARMDSASVQGPFEPLRDVWPTLKPLIAEEIGALYLPWSVANFVAVKREEAFTVALPGGDFTQAPQKYAAKSLTDLRRKRMALIAHEDLQRLLDETGCAGPLAPRVRPDQAASDDESASESEIESGGDHDSDDDDADHARDHHGAPDAP